MHKMLHFFWFFILNIKFQHFYTQGANPALPAISEQQEPQFEAGAPR